MKKLDAGRGLVLAAVALLLGCGTPQQPAPESSPRQQRSFGERAAWARQSVLDSQLPAEAQAALAQLGMVQADVEAGAAHGASTALPHNMPANHQYVGDTDAGFLSHSSNVTLGVAGMDLQPSGAVFPDSFAYIIYRVDDIAQALTTLEFSFGLLGPGAELGVAAYDWSYGANGRWEPLAWQPASSGMSVPLSSQYISAGGDLVFAVFCLSPSALELQSIVVDTDNSHPDYDELEPNNTSLTPNQLPTIPFNGYRGNVGQSGEYDGSIADYYYFTGNVGDMYRFTFTPSEFAADISPTVVDSMGNLVSIPSFNPTDGSAVIPVLITTGQIQPLMLSVIADITSVPTDYTLDAELVAIGDWGETEDNDSPAQATVLSAAPFQVRGSLGNPGFDGDPEDWFQFPMVVGEQHDFVIWYDMALMGFDFANFPLELRDSNGLLIALGEDALAKYGVPDAVVFEMAIPMVPSDVSPFFVNLTRGAGASNYWFESI